MEFILSSPWSLLCFLLPWPLQTLFLCLERKMYSYILPVVTLHLVSSTQSSFPQESWAPTYIKSCFKLIYFWHVYNSWLKFHINFCDDLVNLSVQLKCRNSVHVVDDGPSWHCIMPGGEEGLKYYLINEWINYSMLYLNILRIWFPG